jgi:ribosome-binding protein aMBF1 (putative translation factor)
MDTRPDIQLAPSDMLRPEDNPHTLQELQDDCQSLIQTLARNLIIARSRAGVSQRALATRSGTSQSSLSKIEQGKQVTRLDTIARLAGALDILPHSLVDPAFSRLS